MKSWLQLLYIMIGIVLTILWLRVADAHTFNSELDYHTQRHIRNNSISVMDTNNQLMNNYYQIELYRSKERTQKLIDESDYKEFLEIYLQ